MVLGEASRALKKIIMAAVVLSSSIQLGWAQISTRNHECATLQQMVQTRGTAVLSTFSGARKTYTYKRAKCVGRLTSVARKVPAKDRWCKVGYTCERVTTGGR